MVRSFLSKAALLVLILLLATPVVQAAEPAARKSPASGVVNLFAQAWDLLSRVSADNGCGIDPDGRCIPEQKATAEADNGCRIDPNGGCAN